MLVAINPFVWLVSCRWRHWSTYRPRNEVFSSRRFVGTYVPFRGEAKCFFCFCLGWCVWLRSNKWWWQGLCRELALSTSHDSSMNARRAKHIRRGVFHVFVNIRNLNQLWFSNDWLLRVYRTIGSMNIEINAITLSDLASILDSWSLRGEHPHGSWCPFSFHFPFSLRIIFDCAS